MDKPYGLLIAGFDSSGCAEDEFNEWYDTDHIPERLEVPGFINALRWVGVEDRRIAVCTYDLKSISVLESPPYLALKGPDGKGHPWSRRVIAKCKHVCSFRGDQLKPGQLALPSSTGGLLIHAMNIAPEAENEFNDWYDTEQLPALSALPGCLSARRFKAVPKYGKPTHNYVAIYHLQSPAVCTSKEWQAAAMTPRAQKLLKQASNVLFLPMQPYQRTAK